MEMNTPISDVKVSTKVLDLASHIKLKSSQGVKKWIEIKDKYLLKTNKSCALMHYMHLN